MLTVNDDIIKNIRIKYGTEHPNESFVDDILCNIADDDNYELCGIILPFCNDDDVKEFWKKNLQKENYIHLFPYLVLQLWYRQNTGVDSLESWIESFEKDFSKDIISEITLFLDSTTNLTQLPPLYVIEIGYIIDCFNWKAIRGCPSFTLFAQNHNLFSDDLYGKYVSLFMDSLKSYNKNSPLFNIQLLLNYCSLTDILINKNNCFLSVAEKLSGLGRETSDLDTMLSSIPLEQCNLDTYKNIIVFFCENFNVYKGDSNLSLCCFSDEDIFWKSKASSYGLVLVYFIIMEWYNENNNSIILKDWIDLFSDGDNMALLEEQMKCLKSELIEQRQENPKSIMEKVGYLIETYFWIHYNEVPSLLSFIVISPNGVDNYKKLLFEKIKNNFRDFQANVTKYLQFCLFLDTNASFMRYNFIEILELTSNRESKNIENILKKYPYYGDEFGLSLLHFCEENSSFYNISKNIIAKYKHHLFVDSWLTVVNENLGEDGKPYSIEICERTSSYRKIVEYLDSRHSIFWDKCNRKSAQVINEINSEGLSEMREPARDRLQSSTKELSKDEKKTIYTHICPILSETLKEGILIYINQIKDKEEKKGKKIELTNDVSEVIYKHLVDKYAMKPIPDFSCETISSFYWYADRVARVWIFWRAFASDYVNSEQSITEAQRTSIREKFDTFVWDVIKSDVLTWCRSYYRSSDSDISSDYDYDISSDYDDNDLKGSERVG